MQITLSTRQPNYQEVNLNKDKYRPRRDNANGRWRRDNRPRLGFVAYRAAVGALIRSLDLRAREPQNTCSISDQPKILYYANADSLQRRHSTCPFVFSKSSQDAI